MTDRAVVREVFAKRLDAAMGEHGFKRRADSLTYRRLGTDAEQSIGTEISRHPYYRRSAWLHLLPWFRITMKALETQFAHLQGGEAGGPTMSGSYELVTPKPTPLVYVESPDDLERAVGDLEEVYLRFVVPFLDSLTTPAALVDMYVASRPTRPRAWRGVHALVGDYIYARIAVAAMMLGRRDVARNVAESDLARRYARDRYARLLEQIRDLPAGE
jgi:hypothetical protein